MANVAVSSGYAPLIQMPPNSYNPQYGMYPADSYNELKKSLYLMSQSCANVIFNAQAMEDIRNCYNTDQYNTVYSKFNDGISNLHNDYTMLRNTISKYCSSIRLPYASDDISLPNNML